MALLLTLAAIFLLLIASELWWRKTKVHSEFSRKFIHVTVGSFVAFWPYFMSTNQIRFLSAAFIIVVAVSRYFHLFSAIHSVQRPTWGEVWFAIVVGLLTFYSRDAHVYTAALLTMSLADGLAAIVGTKLGKNNRYRVLGATKSIVGTLTFLVVTSLILAGYAATTPGPSVSGWLIVIAVAATAIENIGIRGIDNLLVPLFVAVSLSALS